MLATTRIGLRGGYGHIALDTLRPCCAIRARRIGLVQRPRRNFTSTSNPGPSSTSIASSSTLPNPIAEAIVPSTPEITPSTLDSLLSYLPETLQHPIETLSSLLIQIPQSLPFLSYGTTIILLVIVVRGGITLPVTLWQRRRLRRVREVVAPEMKRFNDVAAGRVAFESREKGLDYDGYMKALKRELANHQSHLHRLHKTHPTITLLAPLAVHIPLLVLLSLTIRHTLEIPGSPMASESFLWLQSLGQIDSSQVLPILGGMIGFANAEMVGKRNKGIEKDLDLENGKEGEEGTEGSVGSGGRNSSGPSRLGATPITNTTSPQSRGISTSTKLLHPRPPSTSPPSTPKSPSSTRPTKLPLTPAPARRTSQPLPLRPPSPPTKPTPKLRNSQNRTLPPPPEHLESVGPKRNKALEKSKGELLSGGISFAMRGLAISLVVIASQMPAGLVLYWVSTMSFTLGQGLILNLVDKRRAIRIAEASPAADK